MNSPLTLRVTLGAVISASLFVGLFVGCSSSTDTTPATSDAATPAATCSAPGGPTPGAADSHCQGTPTQAVTAASCNVSSASSCDDAVDSGTGDVDGGSDDDSCDYGDTLFGMEGDDDDCKYHVVWTSTPICEGNVTFTVTVTNKTTGQPVTTSLVTPGAAQNQILAETYLPTQPIPACDTMDSTHPSPTASPYLTETSPSSGVYTGSVAFDAPGEWTIRFHIEEQCADICDDSPHGHAAFHITVP